MKASNLQNSELYERQFGWKEKRNDNIFMLVFVLAMAIILSFVCWFHENFSGVQVSGPSMQKTLMGGEYLLMKEVQGGEGFTYGDVVVVRVEHYPEIQKANQYKPENQKTKFLIKRVIAMEGDKVRCTDGQVEICYAGTTEYVVLEETYAYYFRPMEEYDFAEYLVGEGEIFFLGDNRNNSFDSRYQEGNSRLDRLYKEDDVYGVVPQWAIDNRAWLEKIFFWKD